MQIVGEIPIFNDLNWHLGSHSISHISTYSHEPIENHHNCSHFNAHPIYNRSTNARVSNCKLRIMLFKTRKFKMIRAQKKCRIMMQICKFHRTQNKREKIRIDSLSIFHFHKIFIEIFSGEQTKNELRFCSYRLEKTRANNWIFARQFTQWTISNGWLILICFFTFCYNFQVILPVLFKLMRLHDFELN